MPKGSKPNIIHARTWAGKILPGRTKKELGARFKNKLREEYPSMYGSDSVQDRKIKSAKREIRADPGTGPIPRVTKNPVKALKIRAAQKPTKKKK
jgi:hypothetical protein